MPFYRYKAPDGLSAQLATRGMLVRLFLSGPWGQKKFVGAAIALNRKKSESIGFWGGRPVTGFSRNIGRKSQEIPVGRPGFPTIFK
jgi:hypothetical protein